MLLLKWALWHKRVVHYMIHVKDQISQNELEKCCLKTKIVAYVLQATQSSTKVLCSQTLTLKIYI